MKVERVSYDVMTPSAARGILEAIYWKPSIKWVVDRIHVLKSVRFDNIRRNEVSVKVPANKVGTAMKNGKGNLGIYVEDVRQQRAAMVLRDVDYIIEARFEYTSNEDRNDGKHLDIFKRRVAKGQCFHRPYLGCREFAAAFAPVEGDIPTSEIVGEIDLGWMLHDINYKAGMTPEFFRPVMQNGIIECRNGGMSA
ncbi:type I-C CRISPR-associated protein Cas5c [Maridesulfovibrio sp.]|uniref:type I-C CRISPR-associated protein Cas5c n=1 Tax=Maridesulfovibrio sp. TaxID=2795000 RepID=UPI0039EEBEC3